MLCVDNFMLCFGNFVLCFDNFVLCFDNFVLCFNNFVLCFDNFVLCFDNSTSSALRVTTELHELSMRMLIRSLQCLLSTSFPGSSLYLEKVPWLRLVTCLCIQIKSA